MAGPSHVDLVTTDGFLHPNSVLDARGLMTRKGFPESYDTRRLLAFLRDVKSGAAGGKCPCVQPRGLRRAARRGDDHPAARHPHPRGAQRAPGEQLGTEFVSDYFDFSIYIDAEEADILDWFIARFMALRESVFKDPNSFFRHFAALSDDEARERRTEIWHDINGRNLRENILPTRERASLILRKAADHRSPTCASTSCRRAIW